MELFGTSVEYKHAWTQEIERCGKAGITPSRPIPHRDGIILDPDAGGVYFAWPKTKKQRNRLGEALARRDEAQEEVNYFADKHRRSRSEARRHRYLDNWHFEQRRRGARSTTCWLPPAPAIATIISAACRLTAWPQARQTIRT